MHDPTIDPTGRDARRVRPRAGARGLGRPGAAGEPHAPLAGPGAADLPEGLARSIADCGFFPELVAESTALALGGQEVRAHLVHHEATFVGEEVHRHLTVLVLTPSRLLVGHIDESSENPEGRLQAISSTESVPLSRLSSVTLTRVLDEPERGAGRVAEVWLAISWGTMRRVEMEPAQCPDPSCELDHGYSGSLVADDLTVRMSPAADGEDSVRALAAFAATLQHAVGEQR